MEYLCCYHFHSLQQASILLIALATVANAMWHRGLACAAPVTAKPTADSVPQYARHHNHHHSDDVLPLLPLSLSLPQASILLIALATVALVATCAAADSTEAAADVHIPATITGVSINAESNSRKLLQNCWKYVGEFFCTALRSPSCILRLNLFD